VAALVPDVFCNFYLMKNNKIAKTNTQQPLKIEKTKHIFGILGILGIF
jgi:hypothetical protein